VVNAKPTDHIAEIGPADPAALEWLNAAFARIPDDAMLKRFGAPAVPLKPFIRREAEAIRKQAPFRAVIIAAVEKATGTTFQPEATDA
jgi:hypothetical protein